MHTELSTMSLAPNRCATQGSPHLCCFNTELCCFKMKFGEICWSNNMKSH
ncbi:unnamed protein product [Nyctereutes procyonoides]|uniref:(raccoon dog) hypothetical protein n=1 Tax=Nyctereutes procyonoides TaxID=34880 RepID=A0A811YUT6_NYCPR|nr:unnamed protein product [Nyctereutes procyonoides]